MNTEVACLCGNIRLQIDGEPLAQFYCHCDDCQAVHGGAYVSFMLFPSNAVGVSQGEPVTWTYKTLPRQRCRECGAQLFVRLPDTELTAVKADLLPEGTFKPEFHIQCQHALIPVRDDLPHYEGFPSAFGGSDDVVDW